MTRTPEDEARDQIDAMLDVAGWAVQDAARANIHAARGVALRNFALKTGHGFADYPAKVSGRWNQETERLRGSGSRPLVNWVSTPVLS